MRKTAKMAAVLAVAVAATFNAHADFGFGNREEPALRPYKSFWRGVKAFTYNVVKSVNQGNRKFPGLGVVEVGRGIRYGGVELLYGTYMGMAGSRPAPVDAYSWPNEYIDSDWLLRNSADLAGSYVFWANGSSFRTDVEAAAGVFTAQKIVDHSPVLSQREKDLYLPESPRYTAQREYIGHRAPRPDVNGDIDFIRRARRQRVVVPPMLPGQLPRAAAPAPVVAPAPSLFEAQPAAPEPAGLVPPAAEFETFSVEAAPEAPDRALPPVVEPPAGEMPVPGPPAEFGPAPIEP